jgi:hypothetical protein
MSAAGSKNGHTALSVLCPIRREYPQSVQYSRSHIKIALNLSVCRHATSACLIIHAAYPRFCIKIEGWHSRTNRLTQHGGLPIGDAAEKSAKVAEPRQPFVRKEGIMARPQFPKNAGRLSGLNRRQLLASAAAATTACAAAPDVACATAVSIQTAACSRQPSTHFSDATARRLREIAKRNEIRREVKLPLLSIPKELRRMKRQESMENFRRFEVKHGKAVWEQVLKAHRDAEGNPNWRPSWMEGTRLQSEVHKILRAQFSGIIAQTPQA